MTPDQISDAITAARCSIARLAQASGWTLREDLESFGRTMENAITLAQAAVAHGVEGKAGQGEPDPWSGIPDPRRQHPN